MTSPLDERLARLVGETPAPDLTARIILAVAQRRRARLMWQRIGLAALTCALAGTVLVLISWPQVFASVAPALNAFEANDLVLPLNALFAAPFETFTTWLEAGMTWQASQVEGMGEAFILGVALLAVAAFGGLAQMLHARTPNGYSQ